MQKVLIEGRSHNLPLLITLHGGPGTPVPFSVGCRGLFPMFTDEFIMVYWDQLGCGINNYPIDAHFSIDDFVQMTVDLIDEVKKLFPCNRLYIFATSWGSILRAKVAMKREKMIDGVVACGQIIKEVFFNQEVYSALENTSISKKKQMDIQNTNLEQITSRQLQQMSSYLKKYTDAYLNRNGPKASIQPIIWGLFTSPDYRIKDFKAIIKNGYHNNITLWKEIFKLDLSNVLVQIKIPYVILQGNTDMIASTYKVKELVDCAKNSHLRYQIVDHTGHIPGKKMMDCVLESLCNLKNIEGENIKNE
ncbi:MAG: alpha/beta fold hydrolase [Prevotella sp.]|nr:alpha/beta fold hydrolase [Staphylococcus sp.]MCM1349609.1 alpha/beta fold hydrolase [Prevotella sp.]